MESFRLVEQSKPYWVSDTYDNPLSLEVITSRFSSVFFLAYDASSHGSPQFLLHDLELTTTANVPQPCADDIMGMLVVEIFHPGPSSQVMIRNLCVVREVPGMWNTGLRYDKTTLIH